MGVEEVGVAEVVVPVAGEVVELVVAVEAAAAVVEAVEKHSPS